MLANSQVGHLGLFHLLVIDCSGLYENFQLFPAKPNLPRKRKICCAIIKLYQSLEDYFYVHADFDTKIKSPLLGITPEKA
jgi:hypothetical protein